MRIITLLPIALLCLASCESIPEKAKYGLNSPFTFPVSVQSNAETAYQEEMQIAAKLCGQEGRPRKLRDVGFNANIKGGDSDPSLFAGSMPVSQKWVEYTCVARWITPS